MGHFARGAVCRSLSLGYFGSLVRPHRTGGSIFAIKREYGSVIPHRHTHVMIWEIRRGGCVKAVFLLFFKAFLYKHTGVVPVLFSLLFDFLFIHLPDILYG